MEQVARMAGMADMADPTVQDAAKDVELGESFTHQRNTSRASLPHFHQRSQSIATGELHAAGTERPTTDLQAAEQQLDQPLEQEPGEIPWGPEHPCYPHPNPHVPLSSPLYESTRIIRIRRDWMVAGDLAPAFKNIYPEILEPYLSEDSFRSLIHNINSALLAAFDPKNLHNWLDAALGLLTGWLWDDLGFTAIKRSLAALDRWIQEWNRTVGANTEIFVIPLRRTGYMTVDLQIPNPPLGPDVPPTPSLAPTNTSRPGSIRTTESSWTITTTSRSQIGLAADADTQPQVPPIPAQYLLDGQAQRQMEEVGTAA